jgi:hypothetical protein
MLKQALMLVVVVISLETVLAAACLAAIELKKHNLLERMYPS